MAHNDNRDILKWKRTIDRIQSNEQPVDEPIAEGTWSVPETPEQVKKLSNLLKNPLDAETALDELYDVFGDDELFDDLEVMKRDEPETDVRHVVISRLKDMNFIKEVRENAKQIEEQEQLNEWASLLRLVGILGTVVRSPKAKNKISEILKKGWKKIKPGTEDTAKSITNLSPTNTFAWLSLGYVFTGVVDVVDMITTYVGKFLDAATIKGLSEIIWKNKIPVAGVMAIIYGGKMLKDYVTGDSKDEKGDSKDEKGDTTINNYYNNDKLATENLEKVEEDDEEELYFNYEDIGGNIIINPKSTIEDQIFELLNKYYDIDAMEFDPSKIEIQDIDQINQDANFAKVQNTRDESIKEGGVHKLRVDQQTHVEAEHHNVVISSNDMGIIVDIYDKNSDNIDTNTYWNDDVMEESQRHRLSQEIDSINSEEDSSTV
jgi:hypothetical protein|tara:strand:- start:94 stop:1389 length:1296 start_codon:yes stop_codon:yes gene_type:complete